MATIHVNPVALKDLHTGLTSAHEELEGVKHALPDYSSTSDAMAQFRSRSYETKMLFSTYRELFASDAEVFKHAYEELVIADGAAGVGLASSGGGRSGGGSGGGKGGTW